MRRSDGSSLTSCYPPLRSGRTQLCRAVLGQLVDAGLAFCRGIPPQASYLFKHALVQDAAYGTLLRARQQELHGRIATAFEDRFPETIDQQPELLAHHCAQAGWIEKAIAHRGRAGRQSLARSAMVESVAQVRKGLDLLAHLPDGRERRRQELDLQRVLGAALLASKGNAAPETGQAYGRARELCERLGDTAALIPVLGALSTYHQTAGEYAAMRRISEDLLRIGKQQDDTAASLVGSRPWGSASIISASSSRLGRPLSACSISIRPKHTTPL